MFNENLSVYDMLQGQTVSEASFGKIVPADSVLVLSPHHDDEVLGCGGTLLKYLEQGAKVTVIYLTDGRYGIKAGQGEIRKNEALAAWSGYENITQIFWNFTDSRLSESKDEVIPLLNGIINEVQPQIIFTPWLLDQHSDHTYTSTCLANALDNTIENKCCIASYEIAFPLYANHTVNITKQWERKLELIDVYKSQVQLNIKQFITSLNLYRAQLARLKAVKAAESFFVTDSKLFKGFIDSIMSK